MCANCRHTGCWLFFGVLYLLVIETHGQSMCEPKTSGSPPVTFDLRNLSLGTYEVKRMIAETNSTVTERDLALFVSGQNDSQPNIPCQTLYDFISSFSTNAGSEAHDETKSGAFSVKPIVWVWSTVAVVIISAVGLLGVAVVPLVNKSYYNDVIQFLVALAVGCLTGDAFLHLLPHALSGSHGHSHIEGESAEQAAAEAAAEERIAVLKALLGLGGIYFFFLAEKIVSTVSEYRTEKAAEKEERERILNNPRKSEIRRLSTFRESISVNNSFRRGSRLTPTSELGSMRRSSRAPSIIADDILTTGLTAKAMKTVDVLNAYIEEGENEDEEDEQMNESGGGVTLQVPSIKTVPEVKVSGDKGGDKASHGHSHGASDENTVATSESAGHEHGHGHGHSHDLPTSMASVAWMVIMGDGLHNFTDGMAIGVAFADSIAGGISTTVAVFCHELPHELGDFAVLLKTGMRIKEALFFNVVSSVLCFIGMLVGIGVGNVEAASSWIFAFTAGTFVYIAMVDMLPELNSFQVKPGQSRIVQLIIQNAGLITGAGIMLIIAMFEEQLLHLVG